MADNTVLDALAIFVVLKKKKKTTTPHVVKGLVFEEEYAVTHKSIAGDKSLSRRFPKLPENGRRDIFASCCVSLVSTRKEAR